MDAQGQRTYGGALHENPAMMLGAKLFHRIREQAPLARLRFALPDTDTLFRQMEHGEIDVFIGIGEEVNESWVGRQLLTDQFVTAQRKGHPRGQHELGLAAFCSAPHLLVPSAGDPFAGIVDRVLAKLGSSRQVVMSTQSYAMEPPLVAGTDLLCTLPRRLLQQFATTLDLFEPPIELPSLALNAYWHTRNHEDAASIWLREQIEQILGAAGVVGRE